jgi:hypothetical protein
LWPLFHAVFVSSTVGLRKPSLSYYNYVLTQTHAASEETFFFETRKENLVIARSLGCSGFMPRDSHDTIRMLRNVLGDPITRGQEFLCANSGNLSSRTDNGIEVWDSYAQLLILEATQDRLVVRFLGVYHISLPDGAALQDPRSFERSECPRQVELFQRQVF